MARSLNSGGQNPEFILREFEGMNLVDAREAIGDNEFAWCENAIPVGAGSLYPVNGPTAALNTAVAETGPPSYTMSFSTGTTDYLFSVWKNSGRGYITVLGLVFSTTQVITGLTSGQTFATPYNNQGLLVIDPTGYWDWNVTTPNTLTPQNKALAFATNTFRTTVAGGTQLKQVATVLGTGGTWQALYQVSSVTINAGGSGYVVGDSLTLTDGTPTTPANIIVSAVSAGVITGITLAAGGSYPGPTSSALVATGPTGNTVSGGTGTGATFNIRIQTTSVTILTPGNSYSNQDFFIDAIAAGTQVDQWKFTTSGVIGGQGIAAYAGRVWISNFRTVYFTDINSYNSFGGVGGSFFISDSYLYRYITALFVANNYLYIFGDTSIDALSNVTVASGVTSFSRINITASVGTSVPTSIFAYYRAIVFYHSSGFHLLSGASPEKISEKISALVNAITPASVTGYPTVYGGQVLVQRELCAALLFTFTDTFTQSGRRSLIALFFRGRWWVASLPSLNVQAMASTPALNTAFLTVPGQATLFAWAGNALYRAFDMSTPAPLAAWTVKTKLWDGASPLHEKQSINAAFAATWAGAASSGVTLTVDTELASSAPLTVPLNGTPVTYQLGTQAANEGGSQYLGLTAKGGANATQIRLLALLGKSDRDILKS